MLQWGKQQMTQKKKKKIHKYHSQWDEETVAGLQSYLQEVGIIVNINPIVYGSAIKSRQH